MTRMTTKPRAGAAAVEADPRWRQVLARDPGADGLFWYSVASTGVYCRPSCASRPAHPRNVAFHASIAEAQAAGFRPCRRCHPDGLSAGAVNAALVAKACRMIEAAEREPSLADLAGAAELSPAYFHRLFKSQTGVTPKAYAAAHRARRVQQELGRAETVTQAIYDAGYNSNGRFYENAGAMLGMTPSRYRAGGVREELCFALAQCSLGALLVASSARGVVAILLGDEPEALLHELEDRFPKARLIGGDTEYEALVARVAGFVEAPGLGLDLPLDVRGTAFQRRVWQALRDIPAGATASYAEIAARIGAPGAARAVAGACGANALAVAVPCHRVVRQDGSLSGYRWGVARKQALLEREAAA